MQHTGAETQSSTCKTENFPQEPAASYWARQAQLRSRGPERPTGPRTDPHIGGRGVVGEWKSPECIGPARARGRHTTPKQNAGTTAAGGHPVTTTADETDGAGDAWDTLW